MYYMDWNEVELAKGVMRQGRKLWEVDAFCERRMPYVTRSAETR